MELTFWKDIGRSKHGFHHEISYVVLLPNDPKLGMLDLNLEINLTIQSPLLTWWCAVEKQRAKPIQSMNPAAATEALERIAEVADVIWDRVFDGEPPHSETIDEKLASTGKKGENRSRTQHKIGPLQDREKREVQQRAWRNAFETLIEGLPEKYLGFASAAQKLENALRTELAAAIQPRLNVHIRSLPHETYAEKQTVASWVNDELRQLGLAIRCPRTGQPAILIADVQGGIDSASRFRLEIRGIDGSRTRTICSREMLELEIMVDAIRPEPFSRRIKRS